MFVKFIVILFTWKCCSCNFNNPSTNHNLTLVLRWQTLTFNWSVPEIDNGTYIPEHSFLRGFRLWQDSAFLTIPRWKSGVPVTLAKIPITSADGEISSPLLEAFPSWSMQKYNDCFALQSVHSVEIDWEDKLWILDSGFVEELEIRRAICPPKLVIIDLKTNFIVKNAQIPADMLRNGSTFTCMTLEKSAQIAFIADSNDMDSGFVVYNYTSSSFRRFECEQLNVGDDPATAMYGIPRPMSSEFVPIALNTDRNKLYFSAFDSSDLFYVNAPVFLENVSDVSMFSENMGKYGRSVEIISDDNGYMYFDVLNHKAVAQWRESSWVFQYTPHIVADNKFLHRWISALDVDKEGCLWILSTRFREYVSNRLRPDKDNFRIFKMEVPRKERPRRPKPNFNTEYVVLILFIIIIGLIIIEILMFNAD